MPSTITPVGDGKWKATVKPGQDRVSHGSGYRLCVEHSKKALAA
jgi:hypothetical protein